ncbi:MAG: YggT family protein [Treponema sp.]|jgi:YggT family protein|nr:YggT family protein [Treponema sp.]
MNTIMRILGGLTSLYLILIFIRVMLTWFNGAGYGRPAEVLCRITDPYLDWFRRFRSLRLGALDLSPIVAMAVLSIANSIFITLGRYGVITLGLILALILQAVWSAVSFLLGFCAIVLVLRLIAYLTKRNVYSSFWGIIDSISRPVLYRINRIFFRNRLVNYLTGLCLAIAVFVILWLGLRLVVNIGMYFLTRLPL